MKNRLDKTMYPIHSTCFDCVIKHVFAAPHHILIDDLEKTIIEWREKGGIGIHHTSTSDTISQLKKLGI